MDVDNMPGWEGYDNAVAAEREAQDRAENPLVLKPYTNNDWCYEVLEQAYAALAGDSNDAEYEALCAAVELIEDLLTGAGGKLPPRPDHDSEDDE